MTISNGKPTRRAPQPSRLGGLQGLGRNDAPARQDDHRPSQSQPARTGDRQPVPGKGPRRDASVWHLAMRFQQYARADGIVLQAHLPILATAIGTLVDDYGLRDATVHQVATGCTRRELHKGLADRCWYHYPPDDPDGQSDGLVSWDQLVEVIMAEFWSRVWDEYALDHFREHFREYGLAALNHWASLARANSAIARAEQADRPPVMQRATMTDATKEG